MTTYHVIHRANDRYKLTVMSVLVAAFLVALPLMFVHPTAVILLVWFGLVVMAVAWPIEWLIGRAESSAARRSMQRHECPDCGARLEDAPDGADWICESCGFMCREGTVPAAT